MRAGFISVTDLTHRLGVSDMTIRRDLRKLEQHGEVRVVHGGVSALHGSLQNPAFVSRANIDAATRRRRWPTPPRPSSARPTPSTEVDAGTRHTRWHRRSPEDFRGTVVTHSIPVIQLMLNRGLGRVVGLGGELLVESQALAGQITVEATSGLRVRTLFLGAAAVDTRGVYVATDTPSTPPSWRSWTSPTRWCSLASHRSSPARHPCSCARTSGWTPYVTT